MYVLKELVASPSMSIHWNILDDERRALLPLFATFSTQGFYLAGGTGLALQLGHRDSIDFDFFSERPFDAELLAKELDTLFVGRTVTVTQLENNTLSCVVGDNVQLSFMTYAYPLIEPLVCTDHFPLASIQDIGCMKLSAITSRSVEKDYVDLYQILQSIDLSTLLSLSYKKHPALDEALILKSLVYFDDVLREPILYKEGHQVTFERIKEFLTETVRNYIAEVQLKTKYT